MIRKVLGAAVTVTLGLLLLAFRAAAPPTPSPAADALVLRDPSSPSIRFELGRVPRALGFVALGGTAALVALAAFGLARGLRH